MRITGRLLAAATGAALTPAVIGAGFPKPFDLARADVLRGPQGTLFGGSNLDAQLYVKNLANSTDKTIEHGGATTLRTFAPQRFAQTFRPREIGLSLNYGF